MNIEDLMKSKNAIGQPYKSDIEEWIEVELSPREVGILQRKLTELIRREDER